MNARTLLRIEEAEALLTAMQTVWDAAETILAYRGRAAFVKKLKAAHTKAHVLAFDMRRDASPPRH